MSALAKVKHPDFAKVHIFETDFLICKVKKIIIYF